MSVYTARSVVVHVEPPQFTADERNRLEARVFNWVDWTLAGPDGGPGRCGSAEGNYECPKADEERFVRSAKVVDVKDALKVEDAMAELTNGHRAFLVSWYCYKPRPPVMARRYKMAEWQLVPTLWMILGHLQRHLDYPKRRVRRNRRETIAFSAANAL